MTLHIDTNIFYNPILYYIVYGVGLFIASNIQAIKYKRNTSSNPDEMEYVLKAVMWPILFAANLFLLPSKLFK